MKDPQDQAWVPRRGAMPKTFPNGAGALPLADDSAPLRVGVWVDGPDLQAWQGAVIEALKDAPYAHVILLRAPAPLAGTPPEPRWARWLTSSAAQAHDATQRLSPARERLETVALPRDEKAPGQPDPWLARVLACDLDVLLHWSGEKTVDQRLLTAARYGVWTCRFGERQTPATLPPGYWEAMEGHPTSTVAVVACSAAHPEGQVRLQSWMRTERPSLQTNQRQLYWKAATLIPRALRQFAEARNIAPASSEPAPSAGSTADRPCISIWQQAWGIGKHLWNRISHRLAGRLIIRQWVLYLDPRAGLNARFDARKAILPPEDRFWADPHVVAHGDAHYIFVEELYFNRRTAPQGTFSKGHIAVIKVDAEGVHGPAKTVLQAPYHLSYPFVFAHGGRHYMVPESSDNKTIDLYVCERFPDRWVHAHRLMDGVYAVDTTLLYHDQTWWLFANMKTYEGAPFDDELFLFYADDLFTKAWRPHPLNPIVSDVRNARPAGRLFWDGDRLIRPAQDGQMTYGYAMNFNHIEVLTKEDYRERRIHRLVPDWSPRLGATHTFSHDAGLSVVDAMMYRSRFSRL